MRKFSRDEPASPRVSPRALDALLAYAWPGNIRELQNAVERALVVAPRDLLEPDDFPLPREPRSIDAPMTPPPSNGKNGGADSPGPRGPAASVEVHDSSEADASGGAGRSLSSIEEEHIRRVLTDSGYNISLAARILEIDRVTLYNKMRRYGIHRPGTPSLQST
ncbi:MAG: helix-turn-helix domain-containing protein [Candidatus Eisenbacteria bacterium]